MLRKYLICQRIRHWKLIKSSHERTNWYGKYLIIASAAESWNKFQKHRKNTLLKDLSLDNIKTVVSKFYLHEIIYVIFLKNIQNNCFNCQIRLVGFCLLHYFVIIS